MQNIPSFIQYYLNYLEKSQPRIFFQDTEKSMIIHILSLLDFNNIEGAKSYEERDVVNKERLLAELSARKGGNHI